MFQIAFPAALFGAFVPWLMLNRGGLAVLVHPETGDDLTDHTKHAAWLGAPLPPRLDVFKRKRT
jgi:DOPA 4,5-dioxygenase